MRDMFHTYPHDMQPHLLDFLSSVSCEQALCEYCSVHVLATPWLQIRLYNIRQKMSYA